MTLLELLDAAIAVAEEGLTAEEMPIGADVTVGDESPREPSPRTGRPQITVHPSGTRLPETGHLRLLVPRRHTLTAITWPGASR